jgi:5-oxoprolinase (ATP-hydrolysing) subunit A
VCEQRSKDDPIMKIDINSDMGEGFGAYRIGDDEALMGIV